MGREDRRDVRRVALHSALCLLATGFLWGLLTLSLTQDHNLDPTDTLKQQSTIQQQVEGPQRHQIFISYGRGEASEKARVLKQFLQDAGFSCFVDVEDIVTGTPWKQELQAALNSCDALIALINEKFEASLHEKYGCLAEVRRVKERKKFVLPVLLDGYKVQNGSKLEQLALDSGLAQYQEWTDVEDMAVLTRLKRHMLSHYNIVPKNTQNQSNYNAGGSHCTANSVDTTVHTFSKVEIHGFALLVAVLLCATSYLTSSQTSSTDRCLGSRLFVIFVLSSVSSSALFSAIFRADMSPMDMIGSAHLQPTLGNVNWWLILVTQLSIAGLHVSVISRCLQLSELGRSDQNDA